MGRDVWIAGGALALAGLCAGILYLARPDPAYVTVYVGNTVYARAPITQYQTITVDQGGGKINVVVIDEDGVRMESSTCPNQLCVRQGVIHPENMDALVLGNWIVCLPNGVTVELSEGGPTP